MHAHPRQAVLATDQVLIKRLVHVPQKDHSHLRHGSSSVAAARQTAQVDGARGTCRDDVYERLGIASRPRDVLSGRARARKPLKLIAKHRRIEAVPPSGSATLVGLAARCLLKEDL